LCEKYHVEKNKTKDGMSSDQKQSKQGGIWSVLFTHFDDDYKPRGSTKEGPFLFEDENTATRFLNRKLMNWCYKQFEHLDPDSDRTKEWIEEYQRLCESKGYDDPLDDGPMVLADEMSAKCAEYIPKLMDYECRSVKLLTQSHLPNVQSYETE